MGSDQEPVVEYVYVTCPFCGENDFDLPGLKAHLTWYCEAYENTEKLAGPLF